MKRFGLILLCALLILSMTACGNKQADEGTTTKARDTMFNTFSLVAPIADPD